MKKRTLFSHSQEVHPFALVMMILTLLFMGGAYMPPRTFFMPGECVHFDEWTILRMTIWQILSSYGKNTENLFSRLFGSAGGGHFWAEMHIFVFW